MKLTGCDDNNMRYKNLFQTHIWRNKMAIIFLSCLLIGLGFISCIWWYYNIPKYKIFFNNIQNHSKINCNKNVSGGLKFIDTLITQYKLVIDREVHGKFKRKFRLLTQDAIGTKIVISSFEESLIYIFPNARNQAIVDCIDFPIQTALSWGCIDLNNPERAVNLSNININIPIPEAIEKYKKEPAKVIIEKGSWIWLSGGGTVIFQDVNKIYEFQSKSIMGMLVNNIGFKHSSPKIHKNNQYHNKGLLLISNLTKFDKSLQIARDLGRQMADIEIKELITNSKFFKLFMADKKLRPKAENIIQKQERSKKDLSFRYPIWEFKMDLSELREEAKNMNIDSSYADKLLKDSSTNIVDGSLFLLSECKKFYVTVVFYEPHYI